LKLRKTGMAEKGSALAALGEQTTNFEFFTKQKAAK
jgi:hypothetical protein